MRLTREKRNVFVLAVCQVLFNSGRGLTFLVASIAGAGMLGDDLTFATAPITMMLVGTALGTLPAAHLMRLIGRKAGFVVGSLIGAGAGIMAMHALTVQDFILFNAAIFLFGLYSGFAQQYRFAAADTASDEFRAKAIALVLAAGVVGAFTGPEAGQLGKELIGSTAFVGSFAILTGLTVLSGLAVLGIDIPRLTKAEFADPGRPLGVIFRQPAVIVAVITACLGYMVMTFLMTATPLAMTVGHGQPLHETAFVVEWHIVGMFAPGFITGSLIKRYGTLTIISAGNALLLTAVAIGLSGTDFWHFWSALFCLGVGWNFAFTGGTTLLTEVDTPSERAKLQGTNDFIVFTLLAFASLFSGTVYHLLGWTWVNLLALPMIAISLASVLWLAIIRRRGARAVAAAEPEPAE